VRSAHRIPSAVLALATIATLTACAPTYEGVTPSEFAATACTNWATTIDLEEAALDVPSEPIFDFESEDLVGQRDRALEVAEGYLEQLRTARAAHDESVPAVKDGAQIAALFTDYYDAVLAHAEPLVDEFRTIPTDVEPTNAVTLAAIDLFYDMSSNTDFPFRDIEDEKIIEAIGDEPSCVGYVEISQFGL